MALGDLERENSQKRATRYAGGLLADFLYEFSDSVRPISKQGEASIRQNLAERMVHFDIVETGSAEANEMKLISALDNILTDLISNHLEKWSLDKNNRKLALIHQYANFTINRVPLNNTI